jgi:hypothetical protein
MSDEPTLQTIAQQLETGFMQVRAELADLTAELRALAADRGPPAAVTIRHERTAA